MANRRNCIYQGFTYAKNGYKNIHIVCDYEYKVYPKEYCRKCENYKAREKKDEQRKAD